MAPPATVFYTLVQYTLPKQMLDTYALAGPATQFQGLTELFKQTPLTIKAMALIKINFEYLRTGVLLNINQMQTSQATNLDGSITYLAGITIPGNSPILSPEYNQNPDPN